MKRTERCTILGANSRLANPKSSVLQDNNPEAACMMYETHNGRRERRPVLLYLPDALCCAMLAVCCNIQQ